jgi:hypothetical protein
MSNAIRIRRGFRDEAVEEGALISTNNESISSFARSIPTLLRKSLSNFHQIHALLPSIDFFDERLQVTGAEHFDDTLDSMIWGECRGLDVSCLAGSFVMTNK